MLGDFVVDMAVADAVEGAEEAAIDRQVEEECAFDQLEQVAVYDNVVYDQYAQQVAEEDQLAQEIVQQEYQEEVVDQQIRQAQLNREAEIAQQEVADVSAGPFGFAQRALVQQQDYWELRQDNKEERRLEREDNHQDRRIVRQQNREEREMLREDDRLEREEDREINRAQRREDREERRQDREINRWEREQERQEDREERHQARQVRRQERREEREEGREERREEKAQHKQNELMGKYEVSKAQRFESPLFYHHFFEWKEGMGSLGGGELVVGERSMHLGEISKMKLMKQAGLNNTRKAKISHLGGDLLFSVEGGCVASELPLHYMWFAKVVTEKMQLKGCDLSNPYVPERRFTNPNAASPLIDGILYKQSQYLKTWELRYVAISPEGLSSYKDETGGESFSIKRDTTTELWTRFDIHEQMLVIKVHHAGRKTEFGIPIVDFTRASENNWLLAFYGLLFPS